MKLLGKPSIKLRSQDEFSSNRQFHNSMASSINYLELTEIKKRKNHNSRKFCPSDIGSFPKQLDKDNFESVISKSNILHKKVTDLLGKENLSFLFQMLRDGDDCLEKLDPSIGDKVMPILTRKLTKTVDLMDHFFSKNFNYKLQEDLLAYTNPDFRSPQDSSRSGFYEKLQSQHHSANDKRVSANAKMYIQEILIESMKTIGKQVKEFLFSCFSEYRRVS